MIFKNEKKFNTLSAFKKRVPQTCKKTPSTVFYWLWIIDGISNRSCSIYFQNVCSNSLNLWSINFLWIHLNYCDSDRIIVYIFILKYQHLPIWATSTLTLSTRHSKTKKHKIIHSLFPTVFVWEILLVQEKRPFDKKI